MDDAESRLIDNEERNEDGTRGNNPGQNTTNQTSGPPSSFTLLTNEGASGQPGVDVFRPRPAGNLNGPPNPGAIAPPSYQQAIQLEPIPTEKKESVPNEPPPEYSGPSPGYNPSQSGENRFHGESAMSVAEEQQHANAVEDEIGRLIILSTVVQALEERERQNGNAPAGRTAVQGPGQNSGRNPVRITRIQGGPPTATPTHALARVPTGLANGRSINGTRAQPVRRCTTRGSDVHTAWATYRLMRCIIFVIVVIIVAVGGGIGASTHSSSHSSGDDYSYSSSSYPSYSSGNSGDSRVKCSRNTCQNGGTCWKTYKEYCQCAPGYKGSKCEEQKCTLFCHNGGTCRIKGGKAQCDCPSGYGGKFCIDAVKTQCVYNTCHNGGTCWKTGYLTSCECPPGHGGYHCQDNYRTTTRRPGSACDSFPCMNGGRCFPGLFSYRCICSYGTHGDRCQYRTATTRKPSSCDDIVCENGGFCLLYSSAGPQCLCHGFYHGDRCQFPRGTTPLLPRTTTPAEEYSGDNSGEYATEVPYSGEEPSTPPRPSTPPTIVPYSGKEPSTPPRSSTPPTIVPYSGEEPSTPPRPSTSPTISTPLRRYTPSRPSTPPTISTPLTPSSPPTPPPALTEPYLLFSDEGNSIKAAQLDGSNQQTLLELGADLDFDYKHQTLFFSEVEPVTKISFADLKMHIPGTIIHNAATILNGSRVYMEGFAYDWINKNLYWTDSGLMQITVMNTHSRHQKPLLKTRVGELSTIVVDPRDDQRWLYFVGEDRQIEKVGLDGSRHHVLVTVDVAAWTHALTIDFKNNKLYWVAMDQHRLESVDLDGGNRVSLLMSSTHLRGVYSIVQHGDFIYWSHITNQPAHDQSHSYIKRVNITNASEHAVQTLMSKTTVNLGFRDIKIFDSNRQPDATSVCGGNNGGCAYLCLPVPFQSGSTTNFTCACPDGMELGSDGTSCFTRDQ